MRYASELLVTELKRARVRAGLSQRALALRSGVTQGHISQIENGVTDPGLGALIDLSRALDLEVMLVPRKRVAAVSAVVDEAPPSTQDPYVQQAFDRAVTGLRKAADKYGSTASIDRLRESIALLRHTPLTRDDADVALTVLKTLDRLDQGAESARRIREAAETLWSMRNHAAHGRHRAVQGAYSLAGEADADG